MNRLFLLEQTARLASCANYPTASDDIDERTVDSRIAETVTVLDQACINEDHVRQTITEWIYSNHFFPAPAELRSLAWSLRDKFEAQSPTPPVCDECHGAGWKSVQVRKGDTVFDAVVRCKCRTSKPTAA
jgi:hypothetical protein